MYGARAYLAYLGYGAMGLFQDVILRGPWQLLVPVKKLPVPYSDKYWTVPNKSLLLITATLALTSILNGA